MEGTIRHEELSFRVEKFMPDNHEKCEWQSTPVKTYGKKPNQIAPNSDRSDGKSRYGRSHKPRLNDDYLSTDKKVSHYLKIGTGNQMHYLKTSPYATQKSPSKPVNTGMPRKRGRPRKSMPTPPNPDGISHIVNSSLPNISLNSSLNDLEAPLPTSTETVELPALLITPREDALSDSEEVINENDWNVGDLAWACIGGYPFWPCAVTKEPNEFIYSKVRSKY